MRRTLVTLGSLSLILAGCSNDKERSAETTRSGPTTAAARTTAAVPTTSNPLTPQLTAQPLGATITLSDPVRGLEAGVTVFAVDQNIAPDAPTRPSGGHWVGADIQTCLMKADTKFTVSLREWSAGDAHNGQYKANSLGYRDFPGRQYPDIGPVAVGECVRGWILFQVTGGVDITTVNYAPNFKTSAIWFVTS